MALKNSHGQVIAIYNDTTALTPWPTLHHSAEAPAALAISSTVADAPRARLSLVADLTQKSCQSRDIQMRSWWVKRRDLCTSKIEIKHQT